MSKCAAALQRGAEYLAGCVILMCVAVSFVSAQNIIHVPADQPTIQAAISVANNGDTVLVAPGTYTENIDFGGKAITVISSGGPSVTTIDGGAHASVVTFSTGETASSVLSGFTVRNGFNAVSGAGVSISGASPTINGNVITGNHAATGCGISVNGGSPLIQNNTITANDQTGAGDGGDGGGGILVSGSSSSPAAPQITGNTISYNSVAAGGNGGGISVEYFSSPLIQGNLIQGNTAYNFGGGVSLASYNAPSLVQNIILNNTTLSGGSGAGLYVFPSSGSPQLFVINNTIAANSAADGTSGIFVSGFGQFAKFTNNIVVGASSQTAITCSSLYSSVSPVFSYNDAFSASGTASAGICDTTSNPGNISADPLFMSPANNDFHLQGASPAINAGNNSAQSLPSSDFDGNPRIAATIDLGVYEVVTTSAASISPASLSFGPLPAGSTSSPQTATLSSTATTAFQITSVQVTGAFSATTTCATLSDAGGFSGIVPGNTCSFSVTFVPPAGSSPGTFSGTLSANGTNGASLLISLTGTVPSPAPTVSLSTSFLSFSSQAVGTTSALQSVTLTNTSNLGLTIASVTVSPEFSETDNCGAGLAAGASCRINVTFAPTAAGAVSGRLAVNDNAANSPQSVTLSGNGVATPAVSLSPSSLAFGNQVIGTTSAAQTVTLTNNGSASLNISSFQASLPFAQINNCPASLAAGASCSISVTFTPQSAGNANGGVTIFDNVSNSPQSVILTGTGLRPAAVSFNMGGVGFPPQIVGTTSIPTQVILANAGDVALNLSSIATTLSFGQTNNCPVTLAAGANCVLNLTVTPQASGPINGTLTVFDSAAGSPHALPLNGIGVDFTMNASPSSSPINISAGGAATYGIFVNASGGAFNQSVSLSCSGLPSASTCSFSPASVTPGNGGAASSLLVQTTPRRGNRGTPAGTYTITISGSSGNLIHSTTVKLAVH
jgi:Abnormal spindle-like microcephaly-assoc'd, ASPM-SPD-2-Hydin